MSEQEDKVQKKLKVLTFSDHPISKSGIGIQAFQLCKGLLDTGRYSIYSIGGAIKHQDYRPMGVAPYNENWIIQPVDGFGDRDKMRYWLSVVKPDVVLFFTDPRFFIWAFEMEEEIRDVCPIVFWTVWDNDPTPLYNKPIYDCCDDVVFFSKYAYDFHKDKINTDADFHYAQLARDFDNTFFIESKEETDKFRLESMGQDSKDKFFGLFVSRNARRKRPADILASWKMFLDMLPEDEREREKPTIIMHADPNDQEGPNIPQVIDMLGINKFVRLSPHKYEDNFMRKLYNSVDVTLNMSLNEGFGMSVMESLACGTPVICVKTGGMTEQMSDGNDVFGKLLAPEIRTLTGSQMVPYIYEDLVSNETFSKAIYEMYKMKKEDRKELGKKGREYIKNKFSIKDIVDKFDNIFTKRAEEYSQPERLRATIAEI